MQGTGLVFTPEFFQTARLPTPEFFQIARLPTLEFFQDIVETFDLVLEFFQNSSSLEAVRGLFSRYHWNFLEEFFRQFQTCKLNMKIWDGKNQYILSLLFVNDFLRENRWNCNSPKNTYTNDVELFSRNFKQLGPWNFFK